MSEISTNVFKLIGICAGAGVIGTGINQLYSSQKSKINPSYIPYVRGLRLGGFAVIFGLTLYGSNYYANKTIQQIGRLNN